MIYFYTTRDSHGYLSNFYLAPIEINGKIYKSNEHYYQSQKFVGTKWEEYIRNLPLPKDAASQGRKENLPLRKDWESVKVEVMRTAVRAKFSQHRYLKEQILSTNDEILVEHTNKDSYWGDGGNGSGQNMLGKILMEIRGELKNADKNK